MLVFSLILSKGRTVNKVKHIFKILIVIYICNDARKESSLQGNSL